MLGLILLIIVVLFLVGGLSRPLIGRGPVPYGYGYGHGGVGLLGLVLIVIVVLLVLGRL